MIWKLSFPVKRGSWCQLCCGFMNSYGERSVFRRFVLRLVFNLMFEKTDRKYYAGYQAGNVFTYTKLTAIWFWGVVGSCDVARLLENIIFIYYIIYIYIYFFLYIYIKLGLNLLAQVKSSASVWYSDLVWLRLIFQFESIGFVLPLFASRQKPS